MTDERLVEAMRFYAEDADHDALEFAASEPGAALLVDAAFGAAIRRLVLIGLGIDLRNHAGFRSLVLADGEQETTVDGTTIEAAIAAALGDE